MLLRVKSKSSHHKEKYFVLYLYEMMDDRLTYCGNHFIRYINQTTMLYALNLHSDVCQLFLSKTGEKVSNQ